MQRRQRRIVGMPDGDGAAAFAREVDQLRQAGVDRDRRLLTVEEDVARAAAQAAKSRRAF
ncbi:MAG TPA: hypothetical protein VGR52_09675 [Stellaceae bacterium]|nr:hypothetical protein [Stellaceae bacterium]